MSHERLERITRQIVEQLRVDRARRRAQEEPLVCRSSKSEPFAAKRAVRAGKPQPDGGPKDKKCRKT